MTTDVAERDEIQQQLFSLPELTAGRTEMNLCEVPFVLPFNAGSSLKSYLIESEIWDQDTGQLVTKALEVFPSPTFGFPTRFDAAVIRALLTISHRAGEGDFAERKVYFTIYELCKLLQLRRDGRTLKRLRQSMQRLSEVRYRVKNIWWDKKNQQRRSFDSFGLLDRVFIVEGKKGRYKVGEAPESFFVWGDKLFESLQTGYVREIDHNVMNRFETHVADQAYLLLKKRFHRNNRVTFPVRHFFQYHLGMSPNYNISQMRGKLKKGILELEVVGLIEPMVYAERFEKKDGDWQIVFHKRKKSGSRPRIKTAQQQTMLFEDDLIVGDLVDRGVSPVTAAKLADDYDEEYIQNKIEILDWMIANKQSPDRPGGWLRTAIKEDYSAPKDFISKAEYEAEAAAIAEAKKQREAEQAKVAATEEEERAAKKSEREKRWKVALEYLHTLPDAAREELINDAITANGNGLAKKFANQYRKDPEQHALYEETYQDVVVGHLMREAIVDFSAH